MEEFFKAKKESFLLRKLDFELTERCNNNCIHCYINRPANDLEAEQKELSTESVKSIIQEAADLGCLIVRFTGGEPLLRKDFEEIYLFARHSGLKVVLFTNATLITPKLANLFSLIPPREKIEISFYGLKQSSYEGVSRTPGSYEAAKRGLSLLLEKKIPFYLKNVFLPPNQDEDEEFETWATLLTGMEDNRPYNSLSLYPHSRRNAKKTKKIKELRLSRDEVLKRLSKNPDVFLREMKKFCGRFLGVPGKKIFSCGAGNKIGSVDAYGILQPCLLLRHPKCCYTLNSGSLKDAFEWFFPVLRKTESLNPEYLEKCARCFLKSLCEQCPAKSWMESGTMDTPIDVFCDLTHDLARYLGLIKTGEWAWEIVDWRNRVEDFLNSPDIEDQMIEENTIPWKCE